MPRHVFVKKTPTPIFLRIFIGIVIIAVGIGLLNILLSDMSWIGTGPYRTARIFLNPSQKVDKIVVYELFPDTNKVRAIELPAELLMNTWGYPGRYRLGAVMALSQKETGSAALLVKTIQYELGVHLNRYQTVMSSNNLNRQETVRDLMFQVGKDMLLARVPYKEGWLLLNYLQRMINQEIITLKLADIGAITQITEVDGLNYWTFNPEGFDEWYRKSTPVVSQQLRSITVSIENTTTQEGLGNQLSRLFSHQGFDVIRVGDGTLTEKTEVIFGDEERQKSNEGFVVKTLMKGFVVKTANITQSRSDVVIRIGNDLVK